MYHGLWDEFQFQGLTYGGDSHMVNLSTYLSFPLLLLVCYWSLYPKQAGTALIGVQAPW